MNTGVLTPDVSDRGSGTGSGLRSDPCNRHHRSEDSSMSPTEKNAQMCDEFIAELHAELDGPNRPKDLATLARTLRERARVAYEKHSATLLS